ncbi:MAG: dihydrodipicolinate synthase family protein [Deltaproteobacteria bacterium]|nr:dihydrodipicolinate synthase family protein [Deltaproteobacteria bacterium]
MAMPPSSQTPPAGLIMELVTPLTPQGRLDAAGLERLVQRVRPGADGLLAGSPLAGEGLDLPAALRMDLLGHLLDLIDDCPLFFTITGDSEAETRELAAAAGAEHRRRQGAGPLWLADLPLWYHSNRGLPRYYQGLLEETGVPLVLFNLPEAVQRRAALFKHRNLRTQVFKKLAALPGVVGLIYQGDMRRFLNYHLAAVNRPALPFYEADEERFLTRPGAWGVVSAGAQLLPEAWQRVTRACLHPEEAVDDYEYRRVLWEDSQRLLALTALYRSAPAPLLKAALNARGVLASESTAPGTPLPPAPQKQKLLEFQVH